MTVLRTTKSTLHEHWCPHCKSFDGHTGDCQIHIAKLVDVAEAAKEYLMRSVPDPNTGSAAEDSLRVALAALEEK